LSSIDEHLKRVFITTDKEAVERETLHTQIIKEGYE
jgi:hypothetical protein